MLRNSLPHLRISGDSFSGTTTQLLSLANKRKAWSVLTLNMQHIFLLATSKEYRAIYTDFDCVVADGFPIFLMYKLLNPRALSERITGVDLMRSILESDLHLRVFLLGGGPGSGFACVKLFSSQNKNRTTFCYNDELIDVYDCDRNSRIVSDINNFGPDFLFVGLGAPKQDIWISKNKSRLDVGVIIGVGGSFELLSGTKSRAPQILGGIGLEWAYRLLQEPSRLWYRYLVQYPVAVYYLLLNISSFRKTE